MRRHVATGLVLLTVGVLAAGCGGSSSSKGSGLTTTSGSATATATVGGATATATATTSGSGKADVTACRTLRSAAQTVAANVAGTIPSLATVHSRAQLASRLGKLQRQVQSAADRVDGIATGSAPLSRDKQQIVADLRVLARRLGKARSDAAHGSPATLARDLGNLPTLPRLRSAAADLAHRCTGR